MPAIAVAVTGQPDPLASMPVGPTFYQSEKMKQENQPK
jgi:hypothetical protein